MSSRKEEKEAARQARLEAEEADAARTTRLRRVRILGGLVLVAILAVVLAIALGGGSDEPEEATGGTDVAALFRGIPASGFEIGAKDAPVTIEEFIDPQCPFCAQFSKEALPTVIRDYVRPGKVRLILQPLAFIGEDSVEAAKMVAAAAKQDKAWPFLDVLYANQEGENTGYVTEGFLRKVGDAVPGLDVEQAVKDAAGTDVEDELQRAEARSTAVGAESTPALVRRTSGTAVEPIQLNPDDYLGSVKQALDAALAQ